MLTIMRDKMRDKNMECRLLGFGRRRIDSHLCHKRWDFNSKTEDRNPV